jgi:hypothetical protein
MPNVQDLSEAKRALLEKYLRGEVGAIKNPPLSPASQDESVAVSVPEKQESAKAAPAGRETRAPIVPLQPKGSKRPLFYFHVHWQGGAFYCFNMARELGEDQPFYVLEPYKIDGLTMKTYPSLEKMAAEYLETMRTVQPEGPYQMVGFCGGGLIAFEIAQQLHAKGEKADLVVLIEPLAGPAPRRLIWPKIFHGLIRGPGKLLGFSPDQQFNLFIRLRHFYLSMRYPKEYRQQPGHKFWPPLEELHRDWMARFVWTISAYNPGTYPGRATFFWSEEVPSQRRLGWGKGSNAQEVDVHIIPGTHDTCRTDYLSDLTAELKKCIEKAQQQK